MWITLSNRIEAITISRHFKYRSLGLKQLPSNPPAVAFISICAPHWRFTWAESWSGFQHWKIIQFLFATFHHWLRLCIIFFRHFNKNTEIKLWRFELAAIPYRRSRSAIDGCEKYAENFHLLRRWYERTALHRFYWSCKQKKEPKESHLTSMASHHLDCVVVSVNPLEFA